MNKGFTLIELLVVVLIIGILAAIALPQYTKAVERSRTAEAMQKLGDLATAESIYYMQNNEFAEQIATAADKKALNDGDMTFAASEFPTEAGSGRWYYTFSTPTTENVSVTATRDGGMYSGNTLQITITKTGAIQKCHTVAKGTGFDTIASTGGYGAAC